MTQQFENNAAEMKRYAEMQSQQSANADAIRSDLPWPIRDEIDTVKRQLIETQQTIIKLVDAMKKQQQQINDLAKWAADNSDDVSPGGVILPS